MQVIIPTAAGIAGAASVALCLLLVLLTTSAFAQEDPPSDEPIDLGEAEVIGERFEEPAPAEPVAEDDPADEIDEPAEQAVEVSVVPEPALEQVFTADDITASGAATVAELLRTAPGFVVSEFLGGTDVSFQGLPAKFTAVLVDGQRLPGHILERTDLGQLPLGAVERIEVIRGPQTAAYGPDNAAVILNIVTKSGGSEHDSSLSVGVGSLGYASLGLSTGGGAAGSSWFTSLARKVRGSYDFNAGNIDTDGDSYQQLDLFAKYRREFGDEALQLQVDWFTEDSTGFSSSPPSLTRHNDTLTRRQHAALTYEWELGCDERLRFEQSVGSYYHKFERYFIGFEDEGQFTGFTEQLADTRLRYEEARGDVRLAAGAEYNRDRIESDRLAGSGTAESSISAGYATAEWDVDERLELSAALRYDEHSSFGGQLTSRLAALYRTSASSTLSAGIGQGYRSPSLRELNFDFASPFGYSVIGNPGLRPETRWSYNLDYAYDDPSWSFDLGAFRHEITDLIDFVEVQSAPQVFETQNLEKVQTAGLSLNLERRFALEDACCDCSTGGSQWGLGADAVYVPEAEDSELGTRLINSPKLDGRLRVFYELPELRSEVILRRVGQRFTDRANTVSAPAYRVVDLTLTLRSGTGEWRFAALNLLDEHDARFGPEPGRELRLEYSVDF